MIISWIKIYLSESIVLSFVLRQIIELITLKVLGIPILILCYGQLSHESDKYNNTKIEGDDKDIDYNESFKLVLHIDGLVFPEDIWRLHAISDN